MKPAAQGYRVAVIGASSLLGKELLTVLEERTFPICRLITFETEAEELDLPIVDLQEHSQSIVRNEDVDVADVDFAFLAARPVSAASSPSFLRGVLSGKDLQSPAGTKVNRPVKSSPAPRGSTRCVMIDLAGSLNEKAGGVISIPFLDPGIRERREEETLQSDAPLGLIVAPHPATIMISSVLLRLSARFALKSAVAHVFSPASDIGRRAIEELQKQTVNLLSFQKIPKTVFGAQIAFNLLPRLGRTNRDGLNHLESRIRNQVRQYLGDRAPLPALRLFQVPVFYSLALSLYLETAKPETPEKLTLALAGERIRLRRFSDQAPSQVEATGTSDILVDAIAADAGHRAGIWIWAAADNLRLAAENAVEIAEKSVLSQ